jgi:hypothetical protein
MTSYADGNVLTAEQLNASFSGTAVPVATFAAGGSDDTTQLTNAFAYLQASPGNSISFAPGKTYTVSGPITLNGASNFTIFGNGATIKAASTYAVANGNWLILVESSSNGDIFQLHTDGNRANRGTISGEFDAHNWEVFLNTSSIRFWYCQMRNAICDGMCVDSSTTVSVLADLPTDIWTIHCQMTNSFRNNLSVVNSNRFRDYYGVYTSANGTAPQAGIDVEANNAAGVNGDLGNIDARFYGTQAYNNTGYDLSFTVNSTVRAFDIMTHGGAAGGVIIGTANYVEINGITVDTYTNTATAGVILVTGGAGETHIESVRANNITTASQSMPVIQVNAGAVGPVTIRDVRGSSCDCPLVLSNLAGAVIEDLKQNGANAGYMAIITGAGTVIKRMVGVGVPAAIYCDAANCEVSDVTLMNPTATSQLFYFDTGATYAVVRDITLIQQTSIPGGQVGLYFAEPPAFVGDIATNVAGAAWTSAEAYTFVNGYTGATMGTARPALP